MWELLLFNLLPLGVGAAALLPYLLRRRRRLRDWQDAADVCGLQVVETSGWSPQLTTRAGPVTVTLEAAYGDETRVFIRGPVSPSLHAVSIRREPLLRRAPEIEIGDPSFDSTFFIEGPKRHVLALLDAEMRDRMIRANKESRLQISTGILLAELPDKMVLFLLSLLVDIGQRLAQPMDVLQRLTDNAHRDPEPGVRLQNLLLLARELPGEPWTVEALRTACSDPSPGIRLRAAQELGAEGRGVLLELAEGLEDDASSAQAVSLLGGELPGERTQSILFGALRKRSLQAARACLEALGKSGDAAAIDALAKVTTLEEGELASAAALALGATGNRAVEPPLIDALQREQADLRVAAASALGRIGSAAAVLPLQEAAERFWHDLELRRTSRQAIAEIQSRLQGASPGQLSLEEAEAGQLSLAQSGAGQLSLAPDPAGHLSLSPGKPEEPEEPPPMARKEPAARPV